MITADQVLQAIQRKIKSTNELEEQVREQLMWHNCGGQCNCDFCITATKYLEMLREKTKNLMEQMLNQNEVQQVLNRRKVQ